MLREKLKEMSKTDLIESVMYLLSEDLEVRGYRAYISQFENIVKYCEENNLVDNLSDKDDKRYDRGKSFLKDIPQMNSEVRKMRQELLKIEDKVKVRVDVDKNSSLSFIKQQQESGKKA